MGQAVAEVVMRQCLHRRECCQRSVALPELYVPTGPGALALLPVVTKQWHANM